LSVANKASTTSTGSVGLSSAITITPLARAFLIAGTMAWALFGAIRMVLAPAATRFSSAVTWPALSPSALPAVATSLAPSFFASATAPSFMVTKKGLVWVLVIRPITGTSAARARAQTMAPDRARAERTTAGRRCSMLVSFSSGFAGGIPARAEPVAGRQAPLPGGCDRTIGAGDLINQVGLVMVFPSRGRFRKRTKPCAKLVAAVVAVWACPHLSWRCCATVEDFWGKWGGFDGRLMAGAVAVYFLPQHRLAPVFTSWLSTPACGLAAISVTPGSVWPRAFWRVLAAAPPAATPMAAMRSGYCWLVAAITPRPTSAMPAQPPSTDTMSMFFSLPAAFNALWAPAPAGSLMVYRRLMSGFFCRQFSIVVWPLVRSPKLSAMQTTSGGRASSLLSASRVGRPKPLRKPLCRCAPTGWPGYRSSMAMTGFLPAIAAFAYWPISSPAL